MISTAFWPSIKSQRMTTSASHFLFIVCCVVATHGQTQPSAVPFAGCYRIISQKWRPVNQDAIPIPGQFQLGSEPAASPARGIFAMRSVPASGNIMEKLWVWEPRGNRMWISWGTSFGGFRGTLKRTGNGEFVGKVKEWCDSHCEWKRRTAEIRIQRIDCAK